MPNADVDVLIIGGCLSGASVAYHLAEKGIESIIVDAGKIARGSDDMLAGTPGPIVPRHTKMSITAYDSDYNTFRKIHGPEKARLYLELSSRGRELQKIISEKIGFDVSRNLGTLLVAGSGKQETDLQYEHEYYVENGWGKNVKVYDKNLIKTLDPTLPWEYGLFFNDDNIIDQDKYIRGMLMQPKQKARVEFAENKKAVEIRDTPDGVVVTLNDGGQETILANKVVIATNGLYTDSNLEGLIKPKWSFITVFRDEGANLPNIETFEDHEKYITRQDGYLLFGGFDMPVKNGNTRFPENESHQVDALNKWAKIRFPHLQGKGNIAHHYGVFAYTNDELPIVGKFDDQSRISYIVGCNAVGQSLLSYAASLIPGILEPDMGKSDEISIEITKMLSPKRTSLHNTKHVN